MDRFFRDALNVSDVVRWGDCAKAPLQVLILGIPAARLPKSTGVHTSRTGNEAQRHPLNSLCHWQVHYMYGAQFKQQVSASSVGRRHQPAAMR